MKAFKYVILYLLLIQLALPYALPFDLFFKERMDYNLVKDNLYDIDVILDQIALQIRREKLKDYIIILGDSVAYSGPGNSGQSIGHYLQQLADEAFPDHAYRIYNLSMPAMQSGDIYAMLLKLDQRQISTDNIIINIEYKGFLKRNPDPAIVFWLKDELKALDRESFNRALPSLKANDYKEKKDLQTTLHRWIWNNVEMFRYSPFIRKGLKHVYLIAEGGTIADDSIGDPRPWYEKDGLRDVLSQYEYVIEFSAKPFDMSINNPQIYFIDKIIAHQKDKHTLMFLTAVNDRLMYDKVSVPGYVQNVEEIDKYFKSQPVSYLNLKGKISTDLYSDHLHLTSAGYQELARLLWNNFEMGAKS